MLHCRNFMTVFFGENLVVNLNVVGICLNLIMFVLIIECCQVASSHKLPALYLIDSVIKNISESNYLQLFTKNIVNIFVLVFEQVVSILPCCILGMLDMLGCLQHKQSILNVVVI